MTKRNLLIGTGITVAVVAMLGSCGGDPETKTASNPAPRPTVTVTAPAPTRTVGADTLAACRRAVDLQATLIQAVAQEHNQMSEVTDRLAETGDAETYFKGMNAAADGLTEQMQLLGPEIVEATKKCNADDSNA